jgi:hypothetical protein
MPGYRESFAAPSPDAYETLLWDVMKRDATLQNTTIIYPAEITQSTPWNPSAKRSLEKPAGKSRQNKATASTR